MTFSCNDYTERLENFMGELGLLPPYGVPEDDSYAAYRVVVARIAALALQGARLGELVMQASVPGGIDPHTFALPGGWREQALAALADGPLDERCRASILAWAALGPAGAPD